MAHLPSPPGMGLNSWFDVPWAQAHGIANVRFLVKDAASWAPSINTGTARTIDVAVGSAWACGVFDATDAVESVAFAANATSSNRFDFLVARWDWVTGTTVFDVIQGSASVPEINTTLVVDEAKVNRIPGSLYEGLIAVVRVRPGVGTFQPADLVADLRVWGGKSGPLVTPVSTYLTVLDVDPGSEVYPLDSGRLSRSIAGGWQTPEQTILAHKLSAKSQIVATSGTAEQRIPGTHNMGFALVPGIAYEVVARGRMQANGGSGMLGVILRAARASSAVTPTTSSPLVGDDQAFSSLAGSSGWVSFEAGSGQPFQVSAADQWLIHLFGCVVSGGATSMSVLHDKRGVFTLTLYNRGPAPAGIPTL